MIIAQAQRSTQRIVFFNFIYVNAGGAQSTTMLIGELKRQLGVDIHVIDAYGTSQAYLNDLRRHGIEPSVLLPSWRGRTAIGGQGSLSRLRNMLLSAPGFMRLVLALRATLRQLQPDAIWVDTEKALFAIWLAAPRSLPLVYLLRARTMHIKPYCMLAWQRVNAILSVAQSNLEPFRKAIYRHKALHTVHDGIDLEVIAQQAQAEVADLPPQQQGALRIVFPAVIGGPLKGHELGLRAVARFLQEGGQADLLLCGDVPGGASPGFLNAMRQLAHELGIAAHVHFMGWRSDVPAIMARADLVLLPSFTEGLPRTLMEALALARPVIATRVGGIPELVRDGIDGILIHPGDLTALVQALHRMRDPHVRQAMGQAGQDRVRKHFTLPIHAQKFWAILKPLAQASALAHERSGSGIRS